MDPSSAAPNALRSPLRVPTTREALCSKLSGQRGEAVSPPRLGAAAPPLPYLRAGAGAGPGGGRDLVGAGLLGVWAVFQRGVVGPLLLPWKATWALLDFLLH